MEHGSTHLAGAEWRTRAEALYLEIPNLVEIDQADFIRRSFDLLAGAPQGLSWRSNWLPDRARLERLLAVEAFESAALAMLPIEAGYMISSGSMFAATVLLPAQEKEVTAEGKALAYAIIEALILAVMELDAA